MRIRLLLFGLCCFRLLAEDAACNGAACLSVVKVKHGTRCAARDSMEMDLKNVSGSLYLRGYVIFLTPEGTQNEATGLLGPGDTANVYACHVLGTPTKIANTGMDKAVLRYPDTKVRDISGLVIRECDPSPDRLVQECLEEKSECEEKVAPVCERTAGSPEDSANKEKYKSCVAEGKATCETERAQCVARIRRCASGQVCGAGACVPIPR